MRCCGIQLIAISQRKYLTYLFLKFTVVKSPRAQWVINILALVQIMAWCWPVKFAPLFLHKEQLKIQIYISLSLSLKQFSPLWPACRWIYMPLNWVILSPVYCLPPVQRQAIIWTNADLFSIVSQETKSSEIWVKMQPFFLQKHTFEKCPMSAILFRPQCVNSATNSFISMA